MGKSMRSKRKQKLKRERKEKFKVKELKVLKDMLRAAGEKVDGHTEAVMVDADALSKEKTKKAEKKAQLAIAEQDVAMETEQKAEFNAKTLKNEHGNYPVWMNRRQIKRHKKLTSKNASEGFKKGRKRKRL